MTTRHMDTTSRLKHLKEKEKKKSNQQNRTPKTEKEFFFSVFTLVILVSSCTLLGTVNNSAITLIGCIFVDTEGEALEIGGGGFQLQFNTPPLCRPSEADFQPPRSVFPHGGKQWADRPISE